MAGLTAVISPAHRWSETAPGHDGMRAGGQSLTRPETASVVIGSSPRRSAPERHQADVLRNPREGWVSFLRDVRVWY